jgi:malonate decarboxylase alpha subunit
VVLEGNNQKQADFSPACWSVNPQKVHDLHMIMPASDAANIWTF